MSCKPDPVSGPETSGGEKFAVGEKDAVIIVDHGSRRQESNLMLSNGPVVIRMYFLTFCCLYGAFMLP
jgi:sirohydrochlorin ferrochelatase